MPDDLLKTSDIAKMIGRSRATTYLLTVIPIFPKPALITQGRQRKFRLSDVQFYFAHGRAPVTAEEKKEFAKKMPNFTVPVGHFTH